MVFHVFLKKRNFNKNKFFHTNPRLSDNVLMGSPTNSNNSYNSNCSCEDSSSFSLGCSHSEESAIEKALDDFATCESCDISVNSIFLLKRLEGSCNTPITSIELKNYFKRIYGSFLHKDSENLLNTSYLQNKIQNERLLSYQNLGFTEILQNIEKNDGLNDPNNLSIINNYLNLNYSYINLKVVPLIDSCLSINETDPVRLKNLNYNISFLNELKSNVYTNNSFIENLLVQNNTNNNNIVESLTMHSPLEEINLLNLEVFNMSCNIFIKFFTIFLTYRSLIFIFLKIEILYLKSKFLNNNI